jgi:hypothetical protein
VESAIFGSPVGSKATQKLILGRPLKEYMVDVEVDEDLEDIEEFLVVREDTPTPFNVRVDGENPRYPHFLLY